MQDLCSTLTLAVMRMVLGPTTTVSGHSHCHWFALAFPLMIVLGLRDTEVTLSSPCSTTEYASGVCGGCPKNDYSISKHDGRTLCNDPM
jgi:hypothetical protein